MWGITSSVSFTFEVELEINEINRRETLSTTQIFHFFKNYTGSGLAAFDQFPRLRLLFLTPSTMRHMLFVPRRRHQQFV